MAIVTRRAACAGLLASAMPLPAFADERLRAIEGTTGGRLGVSVAGEGIAPLSWRADERFPLCSTFKVLATAAVLAGGEPLDRELTVRDSDLLSYAPVARKAFSERGGRMTLGEICAAAMIWSDNTAANLQLGLLGGPAALTRWVRSTGDTVTRLDRDEPSLNTAIPGDPRDTTSPTAMGETLARLLLGPVLAPDARVRLDSWMVGAQTGFKRLRAGLPGTWTVGDKTGSGDHGTSNVVAILRPPNRPPVIATSYLTGATAPPAACDAAHAEVGRLIAQHVGA